MAFHFRQNSMFHFTLYFAQSILHFVDVIWVCTRDSFFLHSTFNFHLCHIQVFAFDIQLFSLSNSQVFEFDLQVQCNIHSFFHPTFSICPLSFCFPHPTLNFALASFRIRHSTVRIELLPRWSATDGDHGLNWPDPAPLKWWSTVGRETSQWSRLGKRSPLPII